MFFYKCDYFLKKISFIGMDSKKLFIKEIQNRTKKSAIDIIKLCDTLSNSESSKVVKHQLIKSCTSTAANYHLACIARSQKEFFSKICIVAEEADETGFWLELIQELNICEPIQALKRLQEESTEISKIMNAAKSSCYK